MLYFAYGSNMNHYQMRSRCPESKFLQIAYLDSYRLIYDGHSDYRKGAVANIIEAPGERVYGGLFEVKKKDRDSLDQYEGCPKVYQRKDFKVVGKDGNEYTVFAYYRTGQELGKPSKEYRNVIVQGAKECGLSEEYIGKYL